MDCIDAPMARDDLRVYCPVRLLGPHQPEVMNHHSQESPTHFSFRPQERTQTRLGRGSTPLHFTIHNRHFSAVRVLLDAGANPNIAKKRRDNANDCRVPWWRPAVCGSVARSWRGCPCRASEHENILAPSRASLEEARHCEAAAVMIRVLAAVGAGACIVDQNDASLLHLACVNEDVEFVEALIQAGADVNSVAKNSITPLHTACTQGYVATTIALRAAEADATCSTEDDFTPLHFAVFPPNIELVRLLVADEIVEAAASVADQQHSLSD